MAIDRDKPVATVSPHHSPSHKHHYGSNKTSSYSDDSIGYSKKPDLSSCQSTPLTNSVSDITNDHTQPLNDENECRRNSYTYTNSPFYDKSSSPGSSPEISNIPLSMRFMHKPPRSGEFFKQANDPTRRNSLINSQTKTDLSYLNKNSINTATIDDLIENNSDSQTSPTSPHEQYKLVRKKSGEILKPSLKDSSYFDKKRSKSLPSTPTYKQVHFGGSNVVKYFKKKDRPTAISASNSPTMEGPNTLDFNKLNFDSEDTEDDSESVAYVSDEDEEEDEYSYIMDEINANYNRALSKKAVTNYPHPHHGRLINWDLNLPNFKEISYHDKINVHHLPVFLERIFLTVDKKYVLGHIAVKNLSYEKSITVRYTLDNWCTIIEIPTIYVPDVPTVLKVNNYDRFIFKIPLDSLFNSFRSNHSFPPANNNTNDRKQHNVYNLCIRYNIPGNEYWDNNNHQNYLIELTKTISTYDKDNTKTEPAALPSPGIARPSNPSTKIQDHSKKPKYSSSYLKRRVSDSDLKVKHHEQASEAKSGGGNGKFYRNDNGSSDFNNDFIKNNYYLSSPLLSSYNDKDDDELSTSINSFTPKSNSSPDTKSQTPPAAVRPESFKINFSLGAPEDDGPEIKRDFNNPNFSHNSFNKNYLDSKSYKELLDSYCFFTTPKHKGSSDSNTSYSPDDTSRHGYFDYNNTSSYSKNYGANNNQHHHHHHHNNNNNNDSDNNNNGSNGGSIRTVSSFLGN